MQDINSSNLLDLFSGIGGFSLGFAMAGFKTAAFCEIEPDCQKILRQHWPTTPIYSGIKNVAGKRLKEDGIADIDIITGGFPCTDLSCAGKQKGINEGTRSGLWWEMRRVISEIRPKFAVMENVSNFLSGDGGRWFGDFLASLAEIGYDVEWTCISAAAVGKAHWRSRAWIVAYPNGFMRESDSIFDGLLSKKHRQKRCQQTGRGFEKFRNSLELLGKNLRMDDGVPAELDEVKSRVRALGNSIVPEIAYLIARQLRKELEDK